MQAKMTTTSRPLCRRCNHNNKRHHHHRHCQQQQQRQLVNIVSLVGRILLLCFFINAMSAIERVRCEFYIGDYKTTTISTVSTLASSSSLRHSHHHHSSYSAISIDKNNEIIQLSRYLIEHKSIIRLLLAGWALRYTPARYVMYVRACRCVDDSESHRISHLKQ